jgi:hypothetical protein
MKQVSFSDAVLANEEHRVRIFNSGIPDRFGHEWVECGGMRKQKHWDTDLFLHKWEVEPHITSFTANIGTYAKVNNRLMDISFVGIDNAFGTHHINENMAYQKCKLAKVTIEFLEE